MIVEGFALFGAQVVGSGRQSCHLGAVLAHEDADHLPLLRALLIRTVRLQRLVIVLAAFSLLQSRSRLLNLRRLSVGGDPKIAELGELLRTEEHLASVVRGLLAADHLLVGYDVFHDEIFVFLFDGLVQFLLVLAD